MTPLKICVDCKWHRNEYCTHPRTPVDLVTGVQGVRCELARNSSFLFPIDDSGNTAYLCGREGRLFEPIAVEATV